MNTEQGVELPYPGLRPFRTEESHLFFGREEQTDELLGRLSERHFLAVVGSSGCGKSSLVRAGLLAGLETGFMTSAGSRWHFATMLPGNSPMARLAEALAQPHVFGGDDDPEAVAPFLAATLRMGPRSLVDLLHSRPLRRDGNLLLLVDQFEELFSFRKQGGADEAEAFVALLLESARAGQAGEVPVYVIMTMRSDFLGDCAFFSGLPEAINEGQYLPPRLDRAQRVSAIRDPARVLGGDIDTELMNYLLNELGHDADQLPLMQHVLARMWKLHTAAHPGGEAPVLTVEDYQRAGGLAGALADHVQSAFDELGAEQQALAEVFFCALSERTPAGRDISRPAAVRSLSEVMGVSPEEVIAIADVFRKSGRNFLTPGEGVELASDTILGISHESLLRQWPVMVEWLEKEAASAETYRRLAENALLWKQGSASLWRTPNVELAVAWREERAPTAAWARRYFIRIGGLQRPADPNSEETARASDETFDIAMEFLAASEASQQQEEREQRRRYRRAQVVAAGMTVCAFVMIGLAAYVSNLSGRIERLRIASASGASLEKALKTPEIALWLTLAGYDLAPDKESAAKLYEALTLIAVPPLLTLPNQPIDPTDPAATPVRDFAFDASGERLVAAQGDSLALWDMGGPAGVARPSGILIGADLVPNALALGPNGLVAYGDAAGHVRMLDLETRQESPLVDPEAGLFFGRAHGGAVEALVFDSAGTWLATAGGEGRVKIWTRDDSSSVWTLRSRLPEPAGGIHAVAVPPPGRGASFHLATASDSIVRLWRLEPFSDSAVNLEPGKHSTVVRRPDPSLVENPDLVRALAFGLRGDTLLLAQGDDRGVVKVWEVQSDGAPPKLRKLEDISVGRLRDAAFGPEGTRLAFASEDFRGYLYLDWTESRPPERLTGHIGMATSVAFRPAYGDAVATGSLDGTVKVWATDRQSPSPQRAIPDTVHGQPVRGVAFHNTEGLFATTSNDGRVALWSYGDTVRPELLARRTISNTDARARGVSAAFANGRDLLAVASLEGDMVTIWSTGDSTARTLGSAPLARLRPSRLLQVDTVSKWVWDVAFSPDDALLATASADGLVRIWDAREDSDLFSDAESSDPLWELGQVGPFKTDVAFSPNFVADRLVAASSRDYTATVWKLSDGGRADTILTVRHTLDVRSVAFSPDGSLLATGGDDKLVRVWRLPDGNGQDRPRAAEPGEELLSLRHNDVVWSVAFSQGTRSGDGDLFLGSASYDGNVRLWRVSDPLRDTPTTPAQELAVPLMSDVRTRARLGRMVFSPISDVILVGSWDGRAYLYDWNLDEVSRRGWSLVTTEMRDEDCRAFLFTPSCPDFFRDDRGRDDPTPPYARVEPLTRRTPGS